MHFVSYRNKMHVTGNEISVGVISLLIKETLTETKQIGASKTVTALQKF